MKSIYTLITVILLSTSAFGNNNQPLVQDDILKPIVLQESIAPSESIYTPPVFPGCEKARGMEEMETCFNEAIIQYVKARLEYPEFLRVAGIEGTPLVRFSVLKDGRIGNVQIIRTVHKTLDSEAFAIISKLPRMTPATIDGEVIEVQFTLPVNFRLD